MPHNYTQEQRDWLARWYPRYPVKRLVKYFNLRFKAQLSTSQLKGAVQRYGIKSGRTGCFEQGNMPVNKGVKGTRFSPATEFKKGLTPHNTRPLGCERVRGDGYVWVKTAEPRHWQQKHRLLWESVYGPIPPGYTVIFADQNTGNITIENLRLVNRNVLLRLNKNKYKQAPAPLKSSVLALSTLEVAIFERKAAHAV